MAKGILDTLGQYGSILSVHPTIGVPGIEVNTGALGYGLSVGVGIAMAAKMDKRKYKTDVLMGDGEQGEDVYKRQESSSMLLTALLFVSILEWRLIWFHSKIETKSNAERSILDDSKDVYKRQIISRKRILRK